MPALARHRDDWQPRVLSIVRIVAGLLFMEHGLGKLFGFPIPQGNPAMFQLLWFAGVIDAIGGLLLVLGLFTRTVAFIASGEMAIAYFYAHFPTGFYPLANRGDAAILYCFIFLLLICRRRGRLEPGPDYLGASILIGGDRLNPIGVSATSPWATMSRS